MTEPNTARSYNAAADEPGTSGPTVQRRLDPAHTRPVGGVAAGALNATDMPPTEPAAAAVPSPVLDLAQLRLHATQLATHLDAVREDLDRREAELNSRTAGTESQFRAARLWLQERDAEHAGRAAALDQRQQAIHAEEQRLAADRTVLGQRAEDLAEREAALAAGQAQLALREQATEQAAADLNRQRQEILSEVNQQQQQIERRRIESQELSRQLLRGVQRRHVAVEEGYQRRLAQARLVAQEAFQDEYQRANAELASRQRASEDAEALLADAQQQAREAQQQLADARRRHEEQARMEREGLARRQRELDDAWQRHQQSLAVRAEQLDAREAALEETRREVAALHRESLELRLATEELWAKLSDAAPAAGLELSLSKIRDRLAESNRAEKHADEQQGRRLEAVHARLSDQYARLTQEKQDLLAWVQGRQREIEQQAARLCTREQQLDRQDQSHQQAQQAWDEERQSYQAEIRTLLSQIRRERTAV